MVTLRIATFNLENFDETPAPGPHEPTLADRIAVMRPQIDRLRADILCLQEVNGQEQPGQPRALLALGDLLQGTALAGWDVVSTEKANGEVFDERNLAVVTSLPIIAHAQLLNDLVAAPMYQILTANPPAAQPQSIGMERPILHVELELLGSPLHVIVVHLKSKLPTDITGQKLDRFTWRDAGAAAEGSFLSAMKRMSQAVEVRRLVDQILDRDPAARIVVAGDFNSTFDEVPLVAIRGDVEDTGNGALAGRVLVPVENTVPESARYTLFHHGKGHMLDHLLVTRNLLANYRGTEIHNELLHDESVDFGTDKKYPESDHAPVVATFEFA
ncbi:endonuclease/exonuclease/phosphatase family protein [Nocardia iowensis]|uniref:Endonuclease/exonuclease/phosphatase family protein n=1 Tax=Nocardia iowensis TaxID=204891 RepID=A0ABX8S122_NOCIO|nr:endonuclease/exonuclease/phosphatase family protein [Nocardia iowensis]QXN94902.1 endonuclease/exonuclease/phosphatase family protein [Nocardia iowensis]